MICLLTFTVAHKSMTDIKFHIRSVAAPFLHGSPENAAVNFVKNFYTED